MTEYIEREAAIDAIMKVYVRTAGYKARERVFEAKEAVHRLPVADVAPVVRCKDCKHSTLPSELTQRYGKPGTLTCHNMHAPSNRRNAGSNDFCSYGARMDGDSDALD